MPKIKQTKKVEQGWAIIYVTKRGSSVVGYSHLMIYHTQKSAKKAYKEWDYSEKDAREDMHGGWKIVKVQITYTLSNKTK